MPVWCGSRARGPALLSRLLRLSALASIASCGGGSTEAAPAKAAAVAVKPAEAAAAPAPTPVKDDAGTKFAAVVKDLEERAADKPVDGNQLESQLKAIVAVDPKHSAARFDLAVLQAKRGDLKGARAAYEAILRDDPKFVPAAENLAAIWVTEGDLPQATAVYKKIVKADPKNQTSRLALARIVQSQGQHDEAVELCRQVLQRKADEIEAFRIMAASYTALGNVPLAELIIGRGMKVNKDDPQLHFLTAEIQLDEGDLPGGLRTLKQIILLKPDWLKPRARLADIALQYRDYGSAAQQFEAMLKQVPSDRATRLGLAVAYKGLGRYDQAEKLYKEILAADKNDFDAWWNLAVLYHYNLSHFDEAKEAYQQAKKHAPAGDKQAESIETRIANLDRLKADDAARKAREERERKKQEGIATACQAVAAGKTPDGDAIGGEQERIQAAWDLLLVTAVTKIQGGDVPGGDAAARCALGIVPNTPGAGAVACGQLRVNWIQIQDQAGMLTGIPALKSALATIEEAIKCDPENPDPQIFKQHLEALITAQQAGGAAAGDGATPPADAAGDPAAGGTP
ncbi:MAG: tetratricopeptide repeat protein [Deltaproteobacteria bacterium]|nr:tetratricopeptide repeat protein [Deltaproteobacteria bacterium]